MNNRYFWYFIMSGSIGLFVIALVLGFWLFPDNCLLALLPFLGLLAIHVAEVPIASMKIGREKGLPAGMVILKTALFGFTWWLPLKKGIISK